MKIIGLVVLAAALLASPAFAQHGGSRGGSRGGDQRHGEQHDYRGDRHYTEHERIVHRHYDGRRFDSDYRTDHFGRDHIFALRLILVPGGYRFYYGDFWYGITYWPTGWVYADGVYVDYDGDVLYLYNPYHPGVRVALTVILP